VITGLSSIVSFVVSFHHGGAASSINLAVGVVCAAFFVVYNMRTFAIALLRKRRRVASFGDAGGGEMVGAGFSFKCHPEQERSRVATRPASRSRESDAKAPASRSRESPLL